MIIKKITPKNYLHPDFLKIVLVFYLNFSLGLWQKEIGIIRAMNRKAAEILIHSITATAGIFSAAFMGLMVSNGNYDIIPSAWIAGISLAVLFLCALRKLSCMHAEAREHSERSSQI